MEFPKLRHNIEAIPVESEGRRFLCFRDPLRFNLGLTVVPFELLDIIRFFDGFHSLVDIQAAWMRQHGELLFQDDIQSLINQLDEHLLLDSPHYHQHRDRIESQFRASPVRQPAHAGESYPAEPQELRRQLESFFTGEKGAGKPEPDHPGGEIKGIIAPHIDLRVSGACYTWAYKELVEHSTAETFIILGTSHYGPGDYFVPTRKDYQTPLGTMKTDQAFLDALEHNYGGPVTADDSAHRIEHSIEFQVVFLHYLFEGRREVQIVPILCTSFHDLVFKKLSPVQESRINRFIQALKKTTGEHRRPVCFIVGADLAHVGRKFGDPFAAQEKLSEIEREDLAMLHCVESVDAEGFFRSICKDDDQRKICGFPPIYTFLAATDATSGRLLKYEQWSEEPTHSAVTHASLGFY